MVCVFLTALAVMLALPGAILACIELNDRRRKRPIARSGRPTPNARKPAVGGGFRGLERSGTALGHCDPQLGKVEICPLPSQPDVCYTVVMRDNNWIEFALIALALVLLTVEARKRLSREQQALLTLIVAGARRLT
jgi:hypothetical protein